MNIFLLHTVRPGLDTFETRLRERYPGHNIYNYLNDYWNRKVLMDKEVFSKKELLYLLDACTAMQQAGADMIVCTCNSLTPHLLRVREYVEIPIVLIDENMPEAVLRNGQQILVLATAESSVNASISRIRETADRHGIPCCLTPLCRDDAGTIMREGGSMAEHDRIVLEAVSGIDPSDYDVILLTQLSNAHLKESITKAVGLPVITTPDICLEDLAAYL